MLLRDVFFVTEFLVKQLGLGGPTGFGKFTGRSFGVFNAGTSDFPIFKFL